MPRSPSRTPLTALLAGTALVASGVALLAAPASAGSGPAVFVNELHYDNGGTDVGEFAEVAGPQGTDLSAYSLVLYNGNGGAPYSTRPLTGTLGASHVASFPYPTNGVQNGAPDGVALVEGDTVLQFLSYEGSFTAVGGPADGLTSTDIGVAEDGSDPAGRSLQLTGSGSTYDDFSWTGPAADSPGSANAGQSFTTGPTPSPTASPTTPSPSPTRPSPTASPSPTGPAARALVSAVQGSGSTSPLAGQPVLVEAVLTSLKTKGDAVIGYTLEQAAADQDSDPATSEGLYVLCADSCPAGLTPGDVVRASGTVTERFGLTTLDASAGSSTRVGTSPLPAAVVVDLPADSSTGESGTFERVESMRVRIPQTLTVDESFQLARFGELVLSAGPRPYTYTHVAAPSENGLAAYNAELAERRIILDDGSEDQNDATTGAVDEAYPYPTPGLALTNRFRAGDTITGITAVMDFGFGAWRLQPVPDQDYRFTAANPRPAAPDPVGGRLKVASFNVLNYFATLDTTSSSSTGPCGPDGTLDCRGADSEAERQRQLAKIVAALKGLDADVVGLIEVQNDDGQATQQIVDALNAATASGSYAAVDTGTIGTDAIKVALLYRPAKVRPAGAYAVLTQAVDPRFRDGKNRPALVQSFDEVATGARFTVAVNHFKSKGSGCGEGDDATDGSGNCDRTRTQAAQAVADFLATDPTGSGDPDRLIIGDLNAYRNERPITTLTGAGYADQVRRFGGDAAYSFLFDGQLGYLDHALANAPLAGQITGVADWHINADEPSLLDYDDAVKDAGEAPFERKSTALPLYAPDPYRASDHDPLVVGLDLTPPACTSATSLRPLVSAITAGDEAVLQARATPNSVVQLYAADRPSAAFRLAGTGTTGTDGALRLALSPVTNTFLYARQLGCPVDLLRATAVVLVRPRLTLTVEPGGDGRYVFAGTSSPAPPGGLAIELYRTDAGGRVSLAGRTRARASDGTWSLERTVQGSGTATFVAVTRPSLDNLPGSSNRVQVSLR